MNTMVLLVLLQSIGSSGAWERQPTASARGTNGIYRLESARPLSFGDISLKADIGFGAANDFLAEGDAVNEQLLRLHLAGSPLPFTDVSLRYQSRAVEYNGDLALQNGNPAIFAKFSYAFENFGLAAYVDWEIPNSIASGGLDVGASDVDFALITSIYPIDWLEIAVNAGYGLRGGGRLAGTLTSVSRFAAQAYSSDVFGFGLGVNATHQIKDILAIGGGLEVTGEAPFSAEGEPIPLRMAALMRLSPGPKRRVEIIAGAEFGLRGAPQMTDARSLPGVLPWTVFAGATAHWKSYGQTAPSESAENVDRCLDDGPCKDGRRCLDGACRVVTTEKSEMEFAALHGKVIDEISGEPIPTATVDITFEERTQSNSVDASASFKSAYYPKQNETPAALVAKAPGYREAKRFVFLTEISDTEPIVFKLARIDKTAFGTLRLDIADEQSSKPISEGNVILPGKTMVPIKNGLVIIKLRPGRHKVDIVAPGYRPKRVSVTIDETGQGSTEGILLQRR